MQLKTVIKPPIKLLPNTHRKIRYIMAKDIDLLPQLQKLPYQTRLAMKAVAKVLPFRTNNYVVEELIDWNNIPNDSLYRLHFPHPEMLPPEDLKQMIMLIENNASQDVIKKAANQIRRRLNPHPGGQKQDNVPLFDNNPVPGVQHKYTQTVLIFPTQGQHCHAYCTYCFRWPQFVGLDDLKFATRESGIYQEYLLRHREVTDVLITGGDPMTMKASHLALYLEPLLEKGFEHIQNIRIGTKSVAHYPYRYVTDEDSEQVLRLFEKIVQAGKHLAVMAHYTHPRELETNIAQKAISRIRNTGAEIRCQTPIISHINDSSEDLAKMWQIQVRHGCIPYYLFVERPTGAKLYFEMPLIRAWEIYQKAIQKVSGLARTVRGPVMSCYPGKVQIDGIADIQGEKAFILSFLQGRNSDWCKRPFLAKFDSQATWFNDLVPFFGEKHFFLQ